MYSFSVYDSDTLQYLNTESIHINPYRARKAVEPAYIASLARSVRNFGILQPIGVRRVNEEYELIFGECRFKAAQMIGLKTVPAVIMSVSDRDSAVLALLENIHRSELDCFEQASAVADIRDCFGCSAAALSHLLSENNTYIAERLAINELDSETKQVLDGEPAEYAREIVRLKDRRSRQEVLGKVKKYGLNISRTRELINTTLENRRSAAVFNLNMRKKGFEDVKLFLNTVKQSADMLRSYGIDADCEVSKEKDRYEAKISINTVTEQADALTGAQ